ncbi:arginine--tRNA ligase domain protein [Leptospira kirschneri str. 200801925]|nr:arginine--tRNA ligase domain protein [Leptospira kirschneri str. 200801925]
MLGVSTLVRIRELKGEEGTQQETADDTPIEIILEKIYYPPKGIGANILKILQVIY